MLFTVNQKEFINILSKAKKILKTKGTLIQRSIRIEAFKNHIQFKGTNTETEFIVTLPATVEITGSVICENSKLEKMAKKVKTDGKLKVELKKDRVKLSGKTVNLYVSTTQDQEENFSEIKHNIGQYQKEFNDGKKFAKIFDKLKKFAATSDTREHIKVIHIESGSGTAISKVEGSSTNGYTLNCVNMEDLKWSGQKELYNHLSKEQIEFFFGLKPEKFMLIAGDNCGVILCNDNCSVKFEFDSRFPSVKSVVFNSIDEDGAVITLNKEQVINVLRTFYSISRHKENTTNWFLYPDKKQVKIEFQVEGKIKADAQIDLTEITYKGEYKEDSSLYSNFKVRLNCNAMKDIIATKDDSEICLYLNKPDHCCSVFNATDDFNNKRFEDLNLLMPVRQ